MLSAATSAHAATLTTIIPSNSIDQGAVVYANGYIFVSSYFGDSIEVIQDSTNSIVSSVTVAQGAPYGLAYDSNKGEIWVATSGGACAISDSPPFNSIVNVTDTNGFEQAAFDSKTGEVFMAWNGVISVISDSTNNIIVNITQSVTSMVDDSATSQIFAVQPPNEYGGAPDALVISAKTNSVTSNITLSGYYTPQTVYDSGKGEIFVATAGDSGVVALQIFSENSPFKLLKTINLPTSVALGSMAYSPDKGDIFINDATLVAIISDQTYSVATVNDNGTSAGGIAYDSGTSSVYAVNSEGSETGTLGSVAVIADSSSSSSGSNPTPTVTSSTGTSSTAIPTSTPKVPEFSNAVLPLIAATMAAVTLFAIVVTKKKTKPK